MSSTSTPAQTPMVSCVGIRPITRLAPAITPTAPIMTGLRPTRSATKPNTTPPMGRTTKPTAKTASEFRVEATGSPPGKNAWPM